MPNQLPDLLDAEKNNILRRFPKLNDWLTPEIWWSVVEQLRNNKRLAKAAEQNPSSVITALLDIAGWGLLPDGKEAFINVYEIDGVMTAQAQWIWQGGIRRAVDQHIIRHAVAEVIKAGDTIRTFIDAKGRHLEHEIKFGTAKREVIGAYALFWLVDGLMDFELCDFEDIEKAKAASLRQSRSLKDTWKYSYGEMARKTAIRRGLKRMVGKRDPSFNTMLETTTVEDAAIDGTDLGALSKDETPCAKVEVVMDPPSQITGSSGSDDGEDTQPLIDADFAEVGETADRKLNEQEIAMVKQSFRAAKGTAAEKMKRIKEAVGGFTNVESMMTSQLDAIAKALQ